MGLITASASAATSIVYIAHKGNAGANWFAICQQYNNFCERISGSLIGSYIAIALFTILIILSVLAISRNWCLLQLFMPFSSYNLVSTKNNRLHQKLSVCICGLVSKCVNVELLVSGCNRCVTAEHDWAFVLNFKYLEKSCKFWWQVCT